MLISWLGTPAGIIALVLGLTLLVVLIAWARSNAAYKQRHGRRVLNRSIVRHQAAARLMRQHRMARWHARGRYSQVAAALGLLFIVALLFALTRTPMQVVTLVAPPEPTPIRTIPLDKQVATPAPVAPIVKVDLPAPAPAITTPVQTVEVKATPKTVVRYRTRIIKRTVVYDNRIYDNRTYNTYTAPPQPAYVAPRYPDEPRPLSSRRYYH